jgi:hypothetical protein
MQFGSDIDEMICQIRKTAKFVANLSMVNQTIIMPDKFLVLPNIVGASLRQ